MIQSLFIAAYRNLLRNPFFSFINVFGLSAGLSAFLLLFLYVYNEVTYDRFHVHHDRIYRLMENEMEYTKGLTVPYLLENFPEVENGTRMLDWNLHRLIVGDQKINKTIVCVDTGFFNVFTFRFLEGNEQHALDQKYGIVLTHDLAEQFFGDEPALGRTIEIDQFDTPLFVSGVVEDLPENSTVQFEALTNYETGFELDPWLKNVHDWYNTFSQSYVLLNRDADIDALESKFIPFVEDKFLTGESAKPALRLLPLDALHNHISNNESFTFILICVAAGIAIIAWINFINLFTAASSKRIKEIGMRKTMGASSGHLIQLFLGEALLISFIAVLAGILLTFLILPRYNEMFHAGLELNLTRNPYLILILFVFWLVAGILGGLAPSWKLSRLGTISSLTRKSLPLSSNKGFRNSFTSLQFAITIFLIIGTLTIHKQIAFMKNHSLNFDSENVLVVKTEIQEYEDENTANQKFRAVISKLKSDSRVIAVTVSNQVPGTYIENYNMFYTDGWSQEEGVRLRQVDIGPEYFKAYGIRFLEGDYTNEADVIDTNAVVINHKALEELGAEKGLNNLLYASSKNGQPFRIIGVVEDFYYQGLHRDIQPLIHFYSRYVTDHPDYISVRVKPGNLTAVLDEIRDDWKSIPPEAELNYFFADEEINRQYEFVEQTGSLATFFSVLAMILSCLGLLAMIMFVIERRIKEIGIRKVVGASTANILQLFTAQYVKWIILSLIIAAPLAFYVMNKWLENFANKTILSWWVPMLAGLIAITLAIVTILWLTWRAAIKNPVEVLRYE